MSSPGRMGPGTGDVRTTMTALVGVGVGPGDPELVTARAVRVLTEADTVLAPSTAPDAVGRAESIVREACAGVAVERLVFEMAPGTAERAAARAKAVARV